MVVDDVSGVDLNFGYPKAFSTHSGMGAALPMNPASVAPFSLLSVASFPLSAKIRPLPTERDTLALAARIVNTANTALTSQSIAARATCARVTACLSID